jgi:hypothetical protein
MKIIRVTYTAKTEYVTKNQNNIKQVMADLQKLNHSGINYTVCLSPDGKTFTHTAFFKSDEDHKILLELNSFKYFQEQLKANGLENPPKQEEPSLVGSSKPVF